MLAPTQARGFAEVAWVREAALTVWSEEGVSIANRHRAAERQAAVEAAAAEAARAEAEQAAKLQKLRDELTPLKLSAVRRRAKEVGVDEDSLEDAVDAEDAKRAVIELIAAATRQEEVFRLGSPR